MRRALAFLILSILVHPSPGGDDKPKEPTYRGTTLTTWRQRLKSDDAKERSKAVLAIGMMGPKGAPAADDLVRVMSGDDMLQHKAAEALARIGAVEPLIEVASDAKAKARLSAVHALGQAHTGAKSAVPVLQALLSDADARTRQQAAESLGHLGSAAQPALPAIVQLLRDPEDGPRRAASTALWRLRLPAPPELIALLKDPDVKLRREAAYIISELYEQAKPAVPALVETLRKDADTDVRLAILRALYNLKEEAKPAVPILIELIESKDSQIPSRALETLAQIGPDAKPAIPALVTILSKGNSSHASSAETALIKIGLPAAPVLIEKLRNNPNTYRYAKVLGQMRPAPMESLGHALKDKDAQVRLGAVEALNDVRVIDDSALPALIDMLKNERDPRTRGLTAYLISRSTSKEAVRAMTDALADDNREVRERAASYFLGKPKESAAAKQALFRALKHTDTHVSACAAQALAELDSATKAATAAVMLEAVKTADVKQRVAIYKQIGWMGADGRAAVPHLLEALKEAKPEVVTAAASTLQAVGKVEEVMPILAKGLKEGAAPTRLGIARALWRSDDKSAPALPALIDAARDPERDVRWSAILSIGPIGRKAKSAVPMLLELLKDRKDAELFRSAAFALGKIGPDAKEAAPLLIDAVADKDPVTRRYAVDALIEIGPEAHRLFVPLLLKDLAPEKRQTYEAACQILARMGPSAAPAVPALLKIVQDSGDRLAMETLGRIGPDARDAVPLLRAAIRRRNGNPDTMIEALGRIGPGAKAAVPELLDILQDAEQWHATYLAAWALGQMGADAKEAVPGLVHLLDDHDRNEYAAVWVLGRIGPPAQPAVPALVRILKEQNYKGPPPKEPLFRHWSEGAHSIPKMVEIRDEYRSNIGWAAADALKKIDPKTAKKVLP